MFQFVLAGWEGSAYDAVVLSDAIAKGFHMPRQNFYLVDHAGYTSSSQFFTPYRNVRYYLKEQIIGNQVPSMVKELYNLHHASARNCVERILGMLKYQFPIL
ncbi:unnamed protein product, partial [Tuber aestivum]